MMLWIPWLQVVRGLRPACTRSLTFLWMTLVLMGLCCRADNLGVTSFVRVLNLRSDAYTKPEYIMGHSLQAISLLVHSGAGQVAAVPLTSRIHEGLVFSNRDTKTLLDKLVALLFSITRVCKRSVVLVADAYYASGKVITPLLNNGHHLVTRAKTNAVAYLPAPKLKGCCSTWPSITPPRFGAAFAVGCAP